MILPLIWKKKIFKAKKENHGKTYVIYGQNFIMFWDMKPLILESDIWMVMEEVLIFLENGDRSLNNGRFWSVRVIITIPVILIVIIRK